MVCIQYNFHYSQTALSAGLLMVSHVPTPRWHDQPISLCSPSPISVTTYRVKRYCNLLNFSQPYITRQNMLLMPLVLLIPLTHLSNNRKHVRLIFQWLLSTHKCFVVYTVVEDTRYSLTIHVCVTFHHLTIDVCKQLNTHRIKICQWIFKHVVQVSLPLIIHYRVWWVVITPWHIS